VNDVATTVETLDSLVTDAKRGQSSREQLKVAPNLPTVGSVIGERYLLERLLGQGGMGAVFAGRHVLTGRPVALKLLREDPVSNRDAALRMAREARTVGRIQHPNVVAVYDAGFAADRPFIAMELLDGESLEQRIERTGPMSVREAIGTLQQIAAGVEAAHANGIIHRDLKPANILLCRPDAGRSELVKVVDFGISKLLRDEHREDDVLVTSYGMQLGTPAFMSPEQVRGDALDERTDVYAMAVILHYMLTRRFPFHARTRAEVFAKILTAQPEPLTRERSGRSARIAAVVLKGLARDRAHRYPSVGALTAALSRALSHRPTVIARLVHFTAAASSAALMTVPTPLMHAAQPHRVEAPLPAQPEVIAKSEPMPVIVPAPQPIAAEEHKPLRAPKRSPERPKARRPEANEELSAPIVRDDATVSEVKLMSW